MPQSAGSVIIGSENRVLPDCLVSEDDAGSYVVRNGVGVDEPKRISEKTNQGGPCATHLMVMAATPRVCQCVQREHWIGLPVRFLWRAKWSSHLLREQRECLAGVYWALFSSHDIQGDAFVALGTARPAVSV